MPRTTDLNPNMAAFLDMIAWSEIGPELLKESDDGYNVLVGSTPQKPKLFDSYNDFPSYFDAQLNSSAAGRYQFLDTYWHHYKIALALPDFGPESQDRWAIQLIGECHSVEKINNGHIEDAITLCSSRWASLPGNHYGQRQNEMADLLKAYKDAGGSVKS